jgi:hypothetical protein
MFSATTGLITEIMAAILGAGVFADQMVFGQFRRNWQRRATTACWSGPRTTLLTSSSGLLPRSSLLLGIEGFPESTWEAVLWRRARLPPWTDNRLTVDSVNSRETNLQAALEYLSGT